RPGDPRPQELRPDEDARAALFGKDVGVEASEGEKLLVAKAGAEAVDPTIRDQIDLEGGGVVRKSESLADRILNFGKPDADAGHPLDPQAEKERLEREEAMRRAAGTGTVIIEREGGSGFKLPGL
ncbi:MAG TPA: DUF3035 domain-containing protein, partial [Caulobacterales bacterium]|nr:DUF3035 domain-containing protein [Caulobacterales bacterium]